MKKVSSLYYIVFESSGLYQWGQGWLSAELRNKWYEYWRSIEGCYWHNIPSDFSGFSDLLVCSSCSIYLHPMGFTAVLETQGRSTRYVDGQEVEYIPQFEELCDLMAKCAEYVGFEYTLKLSGKQDVIFEFD